jgi:TolB protein
MKFHTLRRIGSAVAMVLVLMLTVTCGGAHGPTSTRQTAPAGRLAFVSRDGSTNHIRLMSVDASGVGTVEGRLTTDAEDENFPNWSPDGKRLVYQRAFDGSAIYVINSDGSGKQRLSPTPGMDAAPSWSPDGTRIVYTRFIAPPQPNVPPMTDIRIMNADGTGDHAILANTRFSIEPRWSANGKIVLASLMNGDTVDIYVINVDGTGLIRLTNSARNGDPVWSPDGTKISFGSDREGGGKLNIFVMDSDGNNVTQLTHFDVPVEAGDTGWSPEGSKIAFERDNNGAQQSDPNAFAEVWTVNADGSGATNTRVRCSGVGCHPQWQPK